jgi:dihydroorotate dehydrogenase
MYALVRPLLFRLDAEQAHGLTLGLLRLASALPPARALLARLFAEPEVGQGVEAFGLRFRNRVGLAAGYDKNGTALPGLACLGFGHIEAGTVTCLMQSGNPRPRVHRVPEAGALINRMGFPNAGVERLRIPPAARKAARIGINIGKGGDTPLERAAEDYCALLARVHSQADYVTVNVSSPNTAGLRDLQARRALEALLRAVAAVRDGLTPRIPLLVKIAPDMNEAEMDDVLEAVQAASFDGVIATNTTTARDGVPPRAAGLAGGLSGEPLKQRATEVVRYLSRRAEGRLPIIGVGGIASAQDALERLEAGATLIQVYTGLVYAGPGLVRQINRAVTRRFS